MSGPLWNAKEETLIPQDLFICSLPRLKGTLAGLPFPVAGFKLYKPESNRQAGLTLLIWHGEGEAKPDAWAAGPRAVWAGVVTLSLDVFQCCLMVCLALSI